MSNTITCNKCHKETAAEYAHCPYCGESLLIQAGSIERPAKCSQCGADLIEDARYCGHCGQTRIVGPTSRDSQQVPSGIRAPSVKVYALNKNPCAALVLSALIVGAGQFYNGDTKKGFLMLGGAIISGIISAGILWFIFAIWSAVDGFRVAQGSVPLWK